MNILLIAGGWSSERDVSLAGGEVIFEALERLGHTVTFYDPVASLDDLALVVAGKDFAFINLHGSPGEDGLIQAMLERMDCPYQGASPASSMLALDKATAKTFFRNAGLPTADWCLLTQKPEAGWSPQLPFPLFIKANTGGSSLHLERVMAENTLRPALDRLFEQGTTYIVEPAITGMEITCGILAKLQDDKEIPLALPPILIKPRGANSIFDYKNKYSPASEGGAEEICPAPISEALTRRIQEITIAAHKALGLSGYSRADFIVPEGKEPVLLEVNTLPGMTPNSLLPKEAAAIGMSYDELISRLIELGMARHKRHATITLV